ncbi:PREDICTED: PRUPE_7G010700 [Prunus dulcis]|uniref:PREDICTED: PRUPE_7G010700 n=1 Tax=Prunus dulcis TaxID=3755 RepID=A0A5E4ER39_PRUDU|nr:hypothetical protein L3X38_043802 [Prunus dulcis]VVA18185.1 PREDICTED: PRUPE_7G010700 [Prunus dulcis]
MFVDVPLFSLLFLLKLAISLVGYPLWIALLNPPGLDHLSKAILICWQIWEARNKMLFQDSHPHPASCFHTATTDGLDVAIDRGWGQIVVEGDSKLVINSVLKKVTSEWSIQQIIQDIWYLSSSTTSVRFQHMFKKANSTANAVAKLGYGLLSQVSGELRLPLSICSHFYFDFFGLSCFRGFVL